MFGLQFTRDKSKKNTKPENIIDVGAHSADEVAKWIHVGCVIIIDQFHLNEKKFVCRALDNRIEVL